MDEKQVLEKIRSAVETGKKGSLTDLKHWIYENMSQMTVGTWQELRAILKTAYGMSDEQLAKEFASARFEHEVDDFTPLVKELDIKGFVADGMEFTSNLEAPNAYGFWSFMTILGAALHRQCHVDMGYFQVWPNISTILIGPSQRVAKSTIANYIVHLGVESERVNFLMEDGSSEGLKDELKQLSEKTGEACGLVFVSEMSTMFGEKDYNSDLVKQLTDLFDTRQLSKKRRTKTHGVEEIKNLALSALFCSNEKWLRECVPPSSFEGGFFARLLPVWCSGTDKIVPIPKLARPEGRADLISFLKRTELLSGVAVPDGAGLRYFETRYRQLKKNWPEDERLHPFWAKYSVHMLRLAMLLSVSEDVMQRGTIALSERHMYQADRLLEWIVNRLPRLYAVLGTTEHGDDAMFVIQYIKSKGGRVSEAKLGRAMVRRMPGHKLGKILNDLRLYGMVVRKPSKTVAGGDDIILLTHEDA